jgi:hypothetical protein
MIANGMVHKQVLVFKHKNKTDSQSAPTEGSKTISQMLFIANILQ